MVSDVQGELCVCLLRGGEQQAFSQAQHRSLGTMQLLRGLLLSCKQRHKL